MRQHRRQYINTQHMIESVLSDTNQPRATVLAVLDVEFEQQVIKGIIEVPGYLHKYYSEDERSVLARVAPDGHPIQDDERLAHDVERFTGISAEVAGEILLAELKYLETRGLVSDGPGLPPRPSRDKSVPLDGQHRSFGYLSMQRDGGVA
jgi:hypothetical protein